MGDGQRIDGEFHYAQIEDRPLARAWVFRRKDDNEWVPSAGMELRSQPSIKTVKDTLIALDATAKHFNQAQSDGWRDDLSEAPRGEDVLIKCKGGLVCVAFKADSAWCDSRTGDELMGVKKWTRLPLGAPPVGESA